MNATDYMQTALTHLGQYTVYQHQDKDYTSELTDDINAFILQLEHTSMVSIYLKHYIRPVTSPRMSKYLTRVFQPIAEPQPSFLKDTKYLLQIIQQLPLLTQDTYLVTADIS